MRTCGQCRFAHKGSRKDERLCMLDPLLPRRVSESAMECAAYEVSAYAYLESVADAEERLEGMAKKAEKFREIARHATGKREAVRSSGGGRCKIGDSMDNCIDIARDLDDEAALLRERFALAREMIGDLPNAEWRKVAQMRHMGRLRWEEIARRMRYDVRQVQRIDGKALRSVQDQLAAHGVKR